MQEPPTRCPATPTSCAGWLKPLAAGVQVTCLLCCSFVTLQVRRREVLAFHFRASSRPASSPSLAPLSMPTGPGPAQCMGTAETAAEHADSVPRGSECDAGPCSHGRAAWPHPCPSGMDQHAGAGPCPYLWLCRTVTRARLGRGALFVTCGAGPGQRQGAYVTPSQYLGARPQRGPRSAIFGRVVTGVELES